VFQDLITSSSNPRVKFALSLRDAKARRGERRILVDGIDLITKALSNGVELSELFFRESALQEPSLELRDFLRRLPEGIRCTRLSDVPMDRIQYGERQLDAIAVAIPPETSLESLSLRLSKIAVRSAPSQVPASSGNPATRDLKKSSHGELFLVLDRMEKPGNLGAALRTADAAGVRCVLLSDPVSETWNPNAIRSSLGAIFTVPLAIASADEIQDWLVKNQVSLFAARADGGQSYTDTNFPPKTALIIGNEAEGLGDRWKTKGIESVHIPMLGAIDSLNASVSGALLMFEVLRQWRSA
jgi:TrmH family RNA methyltransferase